MSDTKFVAHCADCGHAYKVPSQTKIYPCKECGGEVCALDEGPEDEFDDDEQGVGFDKRPISQRHHRTETNRKPLIAVVSIGVVFAISFTGYMQNWFTGESDFNNVTVSFVENWNTGDIEALEASYHPSKREEFRSTLNAIADGRGWPTGFPKVTTEKHAITEGTEDAPELATIEFSFTGIGKGGERIGGWGQADWQYDPPRSRWLMSNLRLIPSMLEPRAAGFREAWNTSDPNALRPYFTDAHETAMIGIIEKKDEERGWGGLYVEITSMNITGEEEMRKVTSFLLAGSDLEVLSNYTTASGNLIVKWKYNNEHDTWFAKGFKSFPD
jgi:hypothetical protein